MKLSGSQSRKAKELIKNADKIADWIYQRKDFDHGILVRIFKEFLSFLGDVAESDRTDKSGYLEMFRDKFKLLTDAFEEGDLILVADILHHEFSARLLLGKEEAVVPKQTDSVHVESIVEKNRHAFMDRYGFDLPVVDVLEEKFSVEDALNGNPVLYINEGGKLMRMCSLYDPEYEASRWAAKYEHMENVRTVVVMQGLLTGAFIRALKKIARDNVTYIVYEPSEELFSFVVSHYDIEDILSDSNVRIVLPSLDEDALYRELVSGLNSVAQYVKMIGIITPGYSKDEKFLDICRQIQNIDESSEGFRTGGAAKEAFLNRLSAFSVLDHNYLVFDLLNNLPKDMPVFMVSGGPSLLKNVRELKRAKGKGLIVAIDRAVRVLLDNGVTPDLMVMVDPQKDPSYVTGEGTESTYFLCAFEANRKAMMPNDGRLIFMHSDVHWNEMPGLKGRLLNFGDVGGGVAPATFLHFLWAKVDNLVLVGQDLAIESSRTHADGRNDPIIESQMSDADGIYGGKVRTRWDFERFRVFMEQKMREYPDTIVTDATEGGALIHGSQVRSLKETIDELCSRSWNVHEMLSAMPKAQTMEQHITTVEKMVDHLQELDEIAKTAPKLEEMCRKVIKKCKYGDIGTKDSLRLIYQFNDVRGRFYSMEANDWLEENWVTDRQTVPDPYIIAWSNEETLPVFENAKKYYHELPKYCASLAKAITNVFGLGSWKMERLKHRICQRGRSRDSILDEANAIISDGRVREALIDLMNLYEETGDFAISDWARETLYEHRKDEFEHRRRENLRSLAGYPLVFGDVRESDCSLLPLYYDETVVVAYDLNRKVLIDFPPRTIFYLPVEEGISRGPLLINPLYQSEIEQALESYVLENPVGDDKIPVYLGFEEKYWSLFLQICDISLVLESGRCILVVGEKGARDLFDGFQVLFPKEKIKFREGTRFEDEVVSTLKKRINRDAAVYENYARKCNSSSDKMVQRIVERHPRILFLTSRFTTAIQYHTRDCMAAAEKLGCKCELLKEISGLHGLSGTDWYKVLGEFQPDVVFCIDHFRFEQWEVPDNVRFITWIQDPLSHIMDNETPKKLGKNDYVTSMFDGWDRFDIIGYEDYSLMPGFIVANPNIYKPYILSDEEIEMYSCDVSIVCHSGGKVKKHIQEMVDIHPSLKRCIKKIYTDYYESVYLREELLYSIQDFKKYILNITKKFKESILLTDFELETLANDMSTYFAGIVYRESLADWLIESGIRNIKLWGNGWNLSPKYADYAMGSAENGETLSKIYQASKINLGNNYNLTGTARVWEAMLSGGFYLGNFIPAKEDWSNVRKVFSEESPFDVFYNKKDLIEKIHYYLSNEKQRSMMIRKGRDFAIRNMTYDGFMMKLLCSLSERTVSNK